MIPMRRSERQVTDLVAIQAIVAACRVCRLAVWDRECPYIVPMSFGALWEGENLTLCFHCAGRGRKLSALRENPLAAFEMDRLLRLTSQGGPPCAYSCDYQSVTGRGRVEFPEDPRDRAAALEAILAHHTGRRIAVTEEMARDVTVFLLRADQYSAKARMSP